MSTPDRSAPRPWGRVDDPTAARTRLLEIAGPVFAEKGVAHVTIADVAAAAGCTRGTVHRHFGDREGLRLAFVEHHAAVLDARLAARLARVDDPAELLRRAVLDAVAAVRADPVLAAWFTDASASTAGRLALRAHVVQRPVAGLAREVLRRAEASGVLRSGVDEAVLGDAVVRVILSLLTLPASGAPRAAATRERRLVDHLLVAAVLDTRSPR